MLVATLLIIFIIAGIWYLAACKAAGEKDKWVDKWISERKREDSINSKWCDDDCYRCEVNSWCKNSEAK